MAPRNLPPLSRRYGFFFCNDCERGWESAKVYCIRGTKKVYFRQGCKLCKTRLFPYDNQKLRCGACGMWDCHCTEHDRKSRARHVDPKKRHPAWLCDKCKAGYPAAATTMTTTMTTTAIAHAATTMIPIQRRVCCDGSLYTCICRCTRPVMNMNTNQVQENFCFPDLKTLRAHFGTFTTV